MEQIKNVFFDLDHTLWDFETNASLAFQKVFHEESINIAFDKFSEVYHPINQEYWKLYQVNKISAEALKYGRLKDTFEVLKLEVSEEKIALISSKFIDYLPLFNNLISGTIEILDYLQPKYQLHIITNGFTKVQENKLINSGLKKYFTTITDSEQTTFKKPDYKIFEHALNQANALKTESIMIGDSLEADIYSALDFGIEAIFFNPLNIKASSQIIQVKKLTDIKTLL